MQNALLDSKTVCFRDSEFQRIISTVNGNPIKSTILIFRDRQVFISDVEDDKNIYYADGSISPVTLSNGSDYQDNDDLVLQTIGCKKGDALSIEKVGKFGYLFRPPTSFWKNQYVTRYIQPSDEDFQEEYGVTKEETDDFFNEFSALTRGLPQDAFKLSPSFGLLLSIYEHGHAEVGIYDYKVKEVVGKRILYAWEETKTKRGHHTIRFDGMVCYDDMKKYSPNRVHSTSLVKKIYSQDIPDCTVDEYTDIIMLALDRAVDGKKVSSEQAIYSFSLTTEAPPFPKILALNFEKLLNPDMADKILRVEQ